MQETIAKIQTPQQPAPNDEHPPKVRILFVLDIIRNIAVTANALNSISDGQVRHAIAQVMDWIS